ncbi:hypothetical protein B0H14DRAFT_3156493 [Mycena olivaceomarginata]|nr:hypothetical protein B0H14DRAFT_3156493 [Mycena olivaceomarginata]
MTSLVLHNPLHHSNFYFSDGKAIFRLHSTGKLYNLHPGFLAKRAQFFKSLFSLPRTPDCAQELLSEGKVDDNPIKLPYCISEMDFDSFLAYLYTGPSIFEMQDGIEHAKAEITRRGNCIHPAVKFELARCFHIDEWIEPTFRRLLDMSVGDLSFSQVIQIGHVGYFWLTHTKAKTAELRALRIAAPAGNAGMRGLGSGQRMSAASFITRPAYLTVTWIWGKGLLTKEEDLIEGAITALHKLQANEPLRVVIHNTRIVLSSDL